MCQALFHAFEIWQEMIQTKISALIELRFQWGERENLTEAHNMLNGNGTVEKGLPQVLVVKNQPAKAGDVRDADSIPGLGRSPGGGHGHPLQYSYLENPMDRGAWWATVHRVTKSQTRPKQLRMHTRPMEENYGREEMREILARVWEQVGLWKVEQMGAQTQRKGEPAVRLSGEKHFRQRDQEEQRGGRCGWSRAREER